MRLKALSYCLLLALIQGLPLGAQAPASGISGPFMYFTDAAQAHPDPEGQRFPNSGYFTIGAGGEFSNFTQAINHINSLEIIGIGGFHFEVLAGSVFNENPPAITKVASEASPVIFQKVGTGPNPIIRATGTTESGEAIIHLNGVSYYSFDGIDLANYGSSIAMEYGYYLSTSQGRACGYNTISNCQITLSSANANSKGIYAASGTGSRNYYNNYQNVTINGANYGIHLLGSSTQYHLGELISGCVITNAGRCGILSPYGEGTVIENNQISVRSGITQSFEGISFGGSSATALVNGNQIIGTSVTRAVTGIYQSSGTATITNNTIRNFSSNDNNFTGILIAAGDVTIGTNTIRDNSSNQNICGIQVQSEVSSATVTGNRVHTMSNNPSSSGSYYCAGIEAGGANTLLANNMIHSLSAATTTAPALRGISVLAGSSLRIIFNTVSLSASAPHSGFSSAALYIPAANNSIELINNIFANQSTPGTGTGGRSVAMWKDVAGFAELSLSCNRNLYWAGTPDSRRLIVYAGGIGYQHLIGYQLVSGGRDANSWQEAPPFVAWNDPHIQSGIQTNVESNALPIIGIELDFDGDTRSATHPDIGADEGFFGETGWTCAPEQLDLGYVCLGGEPGQASLTLSNLGGGTLSFNSSGFVISGIDAASFAMQGLPVSFVIQPQQSQVLSLGFNPSSPGQKLALLTISDSTGNSIQIPLSGIGTQAAPAPYLANWEGGLEGWTLLNANCINAWHIGTAVSYRDQGALYISSDEGQSHHYQGTSPSLVYAFRDVLIPAGQSRLIFNWLCGSDMDDYLSVWLLPSHVTPMAGSALSGTQLGINLYGQSAWQRAEITIPQQFDGQIVRLVLAWENDLVPGTDSPAAIDNLRLLGAPVSPAVPLNPILINTSGALNLSWEASAGANEYLVESSLQPDQGFVPFSRVGNCYFEIESTPPRKFFRVKGLE